MNAMASSAIRAAVVAGAATRNMDEAYAEHAAHAIKLINNAVNLRSGAFARAVYAQYLAMKSDIVMVSRILPYVKDTAEKKEKGEILNYVLDNVYGYNHTKGDDARKAPKNPRQMVMLTLAASVYLYEKNRKEPGKYDGPNIPDDYRLPSLHITKAGSINERSQLSIPGPWFWADEDAAGKEWKTGTTLDGSGTGPKAKTIERLSAIARDYFTPKATTASAGDNFDNKAWKLISTVKKVDLLADELERAVVKTPDLLLKDTARPLVARLQHVLAMNSNNSDSADGDIVMECDDILEVIGSISDYKNNVRLMARLGRIYDAMEEVCKDRNLYNIITNAGPEADRLDAELLDERKRQAEADAQKMDAAQAGKVNTTIKGDDTSEGEKLDPPMSDDDDDDYARLKAELDRGEITREQYEEYLKALNDADA